MSRPLEMLLNNSGHNFTLKLDLKKFNSSKLLQLSDFSQTSDTRQAKSLSIIALCLKQPVAVGCLAVNSS
jgi:hypothetical protein